MHRIPKTSFYRCRQKFESGVRQCVHGNTCVLRRELEQTCLARALIHEFVDNNAKPMPHKSRKMLDGSRETQLVILAIYKQVDILGEINTTIYETGYEKKLSKASFGRTWNKLYPHVALTKTSELSKCNFYSSIKARIKAKPNLQERAIILK